MVFYISSRWIDDLSRRRDSLRSHATLVFELRCWRCGCCNWRLSISSVPLIKLCRSSQPPPPINGAHYFASMARSDCHHLAAIQHCPASADHLTQPTFAIWERIKRWYYQSCSAVPFGMSIGTKPPLFRVRRRVSRECCADYGIWISYKWLVKAALSALLLGSLIWYSYFHLYLINSWYQK